MSYQSGERLYIAKDFYQNVDEYFDINQENKTATLKQLDPKIDLLSIYYCGENVNVEHVVICNQPSLRYLHINGLFCRARTLTIANFAVRGFANLPNLIMLECENINVEKIVIENVGNAETLYNANPLAEYIIKGNDKCKSVSIRGCSTLKYLNCSSNDNLENLVIEPHNSLRQLNCSGNNLAGNFDLAGYDNLEELDCLGNGIAGLENLSVCSRLTKLNCSRNRLESFGGGLLPISLEYLNCTDNLLNAIDVGGLTNLQYLFIGFNKLERLELPNQGNLRILSCGHNSLRRLDLRELAALTQVYCGENDICELILPNGRENQLKKIEWMADWSQLYDENGNEIKEEY